MHTLHTTDALVLGSYLHGESNRVFKLFTRSHGVLYAHAQSVRELANRNRYALRTHAHVSVTLVRGREVWRLASAREGSSGVLPVSVRRTLALAGRLLPVEDPVPHLFDRVSSYAALVREVRGSTVVSLEAAMVLHLLDELGYVPQPRASFAERVLASPWPDAFITSEPAFGSELIALVNAVMRNLYHPQLTLE